jgi:hypothetical protein
MIPGHSRCATSTRRSVAARLVFLWLRCRSYARLFSGIQGFEALAELDEGARE